MLTTHMPDTGFSELNTNATIPGTMQPPPHKIPGALYGQGSGFTLFLPLFEQLVPFLVPHTKGAIHALSQTKALQL